MKNIDEIYGIAMQGYYGGLAEVKIRHTPVPVVYCDFTSQYPTVNALLGIWPLIVAKDLEVQNVTKAIPNLLTDFRADRAAWRHLTGANVLQRDRRNQRRPEPSDFERTNLVRRTRPG